MFHIIFTIVFSFIFSQSIQTTTQEVNTIATQSYTAQQHFEDIKELLVSVQYISPKNFTELANNTKIDRIIKFLNIQLHKEEPFFIKKAVPCLFDMIEEKHLIIAQNFKDHYKENIKTLLQKRTLALKSSKEDLKKLKEERINSILANL